VLKTQICVTRPQCVNGQQLPTVFRCTNLNTKCLWSKKLILKIFSCPTSNYSLRISVLFPWHAFHIVKYVSVREFQLLLMKFLFTWTHIYPTDGIVPLQWHEFHSLLIWYQQRHRGRVMKFMLRVWQFILLYSVFINNLHLLMSNS